MSLATQRVVIACFCAAALAAVGCADGSVNPVSPSASPVRNCRLACLSVLPAKRRAPCDQGVLGRTTARPVTSARSRPRTSMRSRSARGSSMPRRLISGLSRWTATSSSTCPGPATTSHSATATSILRRVSDSAPSRAGPGSSRTSMPASTCRRLRTESIGTGQGRTASIRAIEPAGSDRRLH